MFMFVTVLILLVVVSVALGACGTAVYLLRGTVSRLKIYSTSLQETIEFQQVNLDGVQSELDSTKSELAGTHLLLENIMYREFLDKDSEGEAEEVAAEQNVDNPQIEQDNQNGSTSEMELVEKDA